MVQKNVQDELAVRRELELALLQVFHEYLHLRSKDFHRLLTVSAMSAAAV